MASTASPARNILTLTSNRLYAQLTPKPHPSVAATTRHASYQRTRATSKKDLSRFVPNLKGTDMPYRPGPISPAPKPDITPTVRAVNPFPTHVDSFVRSFPTFLPEGFHKIPRNVVAANPIRKDLINLAVIWQHDNTRQGTHKEKDRAEVSGSRRKMRPQKGTGMARCGDKRPPHWRGGGVAHAKKPRDYSTELPIKVQRAALRSALTTKFIQNQFTVVSSLKEPMVSAAPSEEEDDDIDKETKEELEYNKMKEALQERLETILKKNAHRDFTKRKVLICISRSPEDDKMLAQLEQEARGIHQPPKRERPAQFNTKTLSDYWALYEAVHHMEGVEMVHADELDVFRVMKYQDLIIEKAALDAVVRRLEV